VTLAAKLAALAAIGLATTVVAFEADVDARPNLGIHTIKHVVVIMQENRSFDTYFGTFPGADGIPMRNGVPSVCVPDAAGHACARPFHDRANVSAGGPHGATAAAADVSARRSSGDTAGDGVSSTTF